MALGNVYRLALIGQGPAFAQDMVNVHHYRQTSSAGSDDGTDLVAAWQATLTTLFANTFNVGASLIQFQVRNITQPAFGADIPATPPITGTRLGEAVSPTSAAVISWRTGLIGRSRRGRTYVWPCSEADQAAGQISGAYAANLQSFANAALTVTDPVSGATYIKVIFSEVLITDNIVTAAVVDQILGTQVRRRPGRGS